MFAIYLAREYGPGKSRKDGDYETIEAARAAIEAECAKRGFTTLAFELDGAIASMASGKPKTAMINIYTIEPIA